MSSSALLRRSGALARHSRAATDGFYGARIQRRSPFRASRIRCYATTNRGSDDPKTPKDGKKAEEAGQGKVADGKMSVEDAMKKIKEAENQVEESEKDMAEARKAIKLSMMAKKEKEAAESGSVKAEGKIEETAATAKKPLEPRQIQRLDELNAMFKKGLPKSQHEVMDRMIDNFKKNGIPPEVAEMMGRDGKIPFSLANVAKLIRVANRVSNQIVDETLEERDKETEKEKGGEKDKVKMKEEKEKEKKDEKENPFSWAGQGNEGGKKKKNPDPSQFRMGEIKLDTGTVLISAFLAYYFYRTAFPGENTREITWQEFRNTFFDKGLVDKLTVVNRNRVRVDLHRESVTQMYPESPAVHPNFHYYFTIGSVEAFEKRLDDAHKELNIPSSERIPVAYTDEVSWLHAVASFGPTLLLIGSVFWLSRRAGSGAGGNSGLFGIGKSRAKRFNHETDIKVKFADVAGMDEAKVEIMEFVSFLKEPGQYQRLGAKIPRGAILSGPPGTGKTLLAKATAGESQVPFFSVSGSEFVEMFVGVGPSRVRDLFANARKNTPCIIFIDEIDAIGKSRAKQNYGGGNDERESTLNQILTEMDGFNTTDQVVVLAGTNRPDVLDKALMRPGRFDRHIAIDRPTMDGRKQIFKVHLRKIVTNENMEYLTGRLAALTPGFSGADIANCCNEAALIAARGKAASVVMKHFEAAIERVVGGLEKKSLVLSPEEKRTVAYHEAGHAICGWFFKYADPLLKVSIIPRGQGALGYAQYLPSGDTYLMNVHQLMDRMAMTLGGRVSEELHFDTVTSGASDDFNKVTRLATAMVTKWGMSKTIGHLYFEEDEQKLHKPFSEETARNIDHEVRRIVEEAYKQCKDLLTEKKKEIGLVAEELLAKEVLGREDLIRVLGKRPFEDKGEAAKYFESEGGKSAPPPPPTEGPTGEIPSPV